MPHRPIRTKEVSMNRLIRRLLLTAVILLLCTCCICAHAESAALPETLLLYRGDRYACELDGTFVWSSSMPRVAAVTKNGVITAKTPGETVITCSSKNDSDTVMQMIVTVVQPVEIVTADARSITLATGGSTIVTATAKPDSAHPAGFVWRSADETVAVVDQTGCITAVGKGRTTVTVEADQVRAGRKAPKASITVTVVEGVAAIEPGDTALRLSTGKTTVLKPTVLPASARNKKLIWSTSDSAVATVSNGRVKGVAAGECIITCTAADGSGVSASYAVTVFNPVKRIRLDKAVTVAPGSVTLLTAEVSPVNASDRTLLWSSSDPTVASVDDAGKLTALTAGKCIITCTAADGSGISARLSVTVKSRFSLDTAEKAADKLIRRGSKTGLEAVCTRESGVMTFTCTAADAAARPLSVQVVLADSVAPDAPVSGLFIRLPQSEAAAGLTPVRIVLSDGDSSHTLPTSGWSCADGTVSIDFSTDPKLYRRILSANAAELVIMYDYSVIDSVFITKGDAIHTALNAAWNVWHAAGADRAYADQ